MSETIQTQKKVYIYAGPGVSQVCFIQTKTALNSLFGPEFQMESITAQQTIGSDWDEDAALFVMPGGADIPYMKSLNGPGNARIRSYVEQGGAFLGICAGSYYASSEVDFARGTPLEVLGKRELGFFSGIVRGPILAGFDYESNQGSRAASILWNDPSTFRKGEAFVTYYNGGGYFADASQKPSVKVLANYLLGEEFPSIIECEIGKGKAILSGVHIEYDPELFDTSDPYLKAIALELRKHNHKRVLLLKHLLNRLHLST